MNLNERVLNWIEVKFETGELSENQKNFLKKDTIISKKVFRVIADRIPKICVEYHPKYP